MTDQKILDKIKKLLALAQSSNANEAALALSKAQALMAEHNIDAEAIDLSQIKEAYVKSQFSVSKTKPYESVLVGAIASAFGCEVLWMASASWRRFRDQDDTWAQWVFVGPSDRLQLATYAADVLMPQLKKARSDFATSLSNRLWDDEDLSKDYDYDRQMVRQIVTEKANSFAMGWAYEIQKKVTKFALNDREQQLLDTYVDQNSGDNEAKSDKQDSYDMGAVLAGRAAAKDAHLHRPVGTDEEDPTNLLEQTKKIGVGQ